MTVARRQRFTREHPCPVCGWRSDGADESVRHLGDAVQAVLLDGEPQ